MVSPWRRGWKDGCRSFPMRGARALRSALASSKAVMVARAGCVPPTHPSTASAGGGGYIRAHLPTWCPRNACAARSPPFARSCQNPLLHRFTASLLYKAWEVDSAYRLPTSAGNIAHCATTGVRQIYDGCTTILWQWCWGSLAKEPVVRPMRARRPRSQCPLTKKSVVHPFTT